MYDILVAGHGGQGVKLMTTLWGFAAAEEGKNATQYADYKDEMRGGAIMCSVRMSDEEEISSPIVEDFDIVIAMNEDAKRVFLPSVRPGGILIYNSALIKDQATRDDIRTYPLPASKLAEELGSVQVVSMLTLGYATGITGIVSVESLVASLRSVVPPHRQALLALNERAIRRGAELAEEIASASAP